ncbi:MAG: cation diffusion facilitator family transporter [Alphaproteobacteria bacterium]
MTVCNHTHIAQRASYVAMAMALVLVVLKIAAWSVSGSVSVFASMLDSLMDALMSLGNALAAGYASKPADDDHRFGHHSIEDIMGLLQGAFVSGIAVFALLQGVEQLIRPTPLHNDIWALAVMGLSITLTLSLVVYQQILMKKTSSVILRADYAHYLSDVLTNGGVVVAILIASATEWVAVDGLLGIGIAVYVLWHVSMHVVLPAYHRLMDHALPPEQEAAIIAIIREYPGIQGYHRLKTRASGSKIFIQVHLDLSGHQTLFQAHAIADGLEKQLEALYPHADVIVHQDPV